MEQHNEALSLFGGRDQRRAVGERRPHLQLARHGGIGENLPVDLDVLRDSETAERALLLEGCERLRRAPGERAAERAAAPAQGHRQQLIAALLEPGAREANEHAARFEPGLELFLGAGDELADIGEHDGRDLLLDQAMDGVGDIAFARRDDVGIGRERALHIIERREQWLRRLARFARDDADTMPLRAPVEEMHRAGGPLACDLDARHLIANFQRQVEIGGGLARVPADGEGSFAERLAPAGERLDHARTRAFGGAHHPGGELAFVAGGLAKGERRVVALGTQHGETAAAPGKLGKRFRESVALAIVETVRHPQHAVVRLAAELLFKRGRERRAVGRVRLRHHPANALARLLGAHGIADRLAGRGESEQHGAAVAAGALDRSLDRLAPLGPMRGRRPAIVDDEEEGTFAGETLLVGVQHGPRQSENQQGREQHAQGGQPPWAVRRRLLGGLEILQQPCRREHDDLRAWRRQPQQPPDGGKRGQCREHPRLKEADCADGHHGCRPASAPLTGSGRGGR